MHLKSVGFTDTVLFPTIGNAENVHLQYVGNSVVDPKLFLPDPDPTLTLISDPACL
jgi:hypothetical protein